MEVETLATTWCDITDGPSLYRERLVKARKPQKCCESNRVISPGEMYWRITGLWDNDFLSFTQSQAAYIMCRYINRHLLGVCAIPFGGLREFITEHEQREPVLAEWFKAIQQPAKGKEADHA